ncbi:uncharacterized protein EV420DRAFT_1540153 [Desarmillaria tabescens]|uniref:Uncharacterized protein n=1 Tax=Armillaria tabescens TaxID=1929756 RepID=A0AA39KCM6_ARMTA|nr:uncharacterized protein EV420DRAFT_1540153 [Desarmillaria tabescens]KAK0458706.1 hypothetical protein EV420DRAFT_1540153 [Desarmillaria tabescens]
MVITRTVLVDDSLLQYNPSVGSSTGSSQWDIGQGHTSQFINSSTHDAAHDGLSFAYSFYGTSLAWTGVLWGTEDVSFSISVDDGNVTTCNASGGDEESNIYKQLCQVNNLSNSAHTVNVTCRGVDSESPVSIDYVTYTVDTVSGSVLQRFMVANSGDTFKTNGSSGDSIIFSPHGGGVHRSNSAGSRFTFQFSGSAVSVYGVQQLASGNLAISFEIDGSSQNGFNVSGSGNNDNALANLPLLSATDLVPGDHEVIVTLTEVSGDQIFELDYVLYEPIYGESEDNGSTTSSDDEGSKSNTGTIVGAVFASLVAFAVLSSLAYWWWKRKHRASRDFEIDGTKEAFQYKIVPTTESSKGSIGVTTPPPALIAPSTSPQLSSRDVPFSQDQNVPRQAHPLPLDANGIDAHSLSASRSQYTQIANTPTPRAFNSFVHSPPTLSRDIPFAQEQISPTRQLNSTPLSTQANPVENVYATIVTGTSDRRTSSHSTNDDPPPVPSKAITGTARLSFIPDRDVIASQLAILEKIKPPSPEPNILHAPSAFPSAKFNPVPSQSAKLDEVYANRRRSLDGPISGTSSTSPSQQAKLQGTDSLSNVGTRPGTVSAASEVLPSQAAKLEKIQDQLQRITSPTGTLSPTSPTSLLSPFSSVVASQAAILAKRQEMMQNSAGPGLSSDSEPGATVPVHDAHDETGETQDLEEEEQVAELRRRNEMLVREIARLSDLPPPAYTDSSS